MFGGKRGGVGVAEGRAHCCELGAAGSLDAAFVVGACHAEQHQHHGINDCVLKFQLLRKRQFIETRSTPALQYI